MSSILKLFLTNTKCPVNPFVNNQNRAWVILQGIVLTIYLFHKAVLIVDSLFASDNRVLFRNVSIVLCEVEII